MSVRLRSATRSKDFARLLLRGRKRIRSKDGRVVARSSPATEAE